MFLKKLLAAIGIAFIASATQAADCAGTDIPAKLQTVKACQAIDAVRAKHPRATLKGGTITSIDERSAGVLMVFLKESGPITVDVRGRERPRLERGAEAIFFLDHTDRLVRHVAIARTPADIY